MLSAWKQLVHFLSSVVKSGAARGSVPAKWGPEAATARTALCGRQALVGEGYERATCIALRLVTCQWKLRKTATRREGPGRRKTRRRNIILLFILRTLVPAPLRHFLPLLCEHFTSLLFATFRLKRRINMTGMKNAASTWLPCFSLFKPTQCFAKAHDTVLVQTLAGGAGSNHMSIGACLAGVNYGVRA